LQAVRTRRRETQECSSAHARRCKSPATAGLNTVVKCGDLVKIDIGDGWTSVFNTYRIMSIELDCKTNILSVTVTKDDLS
jgi:hypothetical protein